MIWKRQHDDAIATGSASVELEVSVADFLAYQSRRYVAECEALGRHAPMPDVLEIMTDRIVYCDAVATGFYPAKPAGAGLVVSGEAPC